MKTATMPVVRAVMAAAAIAFALVVTMGAPGRAAAQPAPPAGAASLDPAQLQALVSSLENEAERKKLIDQLKTLVSAQRAVAPAPEASARSAFVVQLSGAVAGVSAALVAGAAALRSLPEEALALWEQLKDPQVLLEIGVRAGFVLGIFLVAFLAEALLKRLLRPVRQGLEARIRLDRDAADETRAQGLKAMLKGPWPRRIAMLLLRTALDLMPVAAFAGAAFAIYAVAPLEGVLALAVGLLINANVLVRIVIVVARVLLAPGQKSTRLLPLPDETAAYLNIWVRRFAGTAIYGYFVLDAARRLGLPEGAFAVLGDLLAILLAGMAVVLILQVRPQVAAVLRSKAADAGEVRLASLRDRFADIWHLAGILYVGAALAIYVLEVEGGLAFLARATALTALTLGLSTLAFMGISRLVARIFRLNAELTRAYPLLEERANRFVPVLHRILSGTVMLIAGLSLLETWGAHPVLWLASPEGLDMIARGITIALAVGAAYVFWEIFCGIIETIRRSPAGRSTRMQTLLAFFQNAVRVTLVAVVAVVVLGELGMNVAPLLAGAGVLGLAIGFGAQTLVKDVITGILLLMEDTVAVGDTVVIGAVSGKVEAISIRTIQLRDDAGTIHALPFSQVGMISNVTRDYTFVTFNVEVAYDTDVDALIKVLREVDEEMRREEPFASQVTAPLAILGVDRFTDDTLVMRMEFRIEPQPYGLRFRVRRAFLKRLKAAFDAHGIERPVPRHTVVLSSADAQRTRARLAAAPPLILMEEGA